RAERLDLRVCFSVTGVVSLANDHVFPYDHGADHRVRRRLSPAFFCEGERAPHEQGVTLVCALRGYAHVEFSIGALNITPEAPRPNTRSDQRRRQNAEGRRQTTATICHLPSAISFSLPSGVSPVAASVRDPEPHRRVRQRIIRPLARERVVRVDLS